MKKHDGLVVAKPFGADEVVKHGLEAVQAVERRHIDATLKKACRL